MSTFDDSAAKEQLTTLYNSTSKHSNYQVLPSRLRNLIESDKLVVQSRSELERWEYIQNNHSFTNENVVDVGANSGFFSFESLEAGAKNVLAIEGNTSHATFISECARLLHIDGLSAQNRYISFPDCSDLPHSDTLILLNVLHHLGDDFGDQTLQKEEALKLMSRSLQNLATKTKTLIFQLGFNWKGNRNLPLFENGTKAELIAFIEKAIAGFWQIETIGIAEKVAGRIEFKPLNEQNIERRDDLGEFLNRPLFILSSIQ